MVLRHDNQLPFDNPNLNWMENQQGNTIQGLHALAWKQQTDFIGYRKAATLLIKIVEQAENDEHHLLEEILVIILIRLCLREKVPWYNQMLNTCRISLELIEDKDEFPVVLWVLIEEKAKEKMIDNQIVSQNPVPDEEGV